MLAKAKDLDPNRSELTPSRRVQNSIMTALIRFFLNSAKVINGFGDNPRVCEVIRFWACIGGLDGAVIADKKNKHIDCVFQPAFWAGAWG
jgi:hypothetical protein